MITKEQALGLRYKQEIHVNGCKDLIGPKGGRTEKIETWRVSGMVKTWKTRPAEFSVPIKFGLYGNSYLTDQNAADFHLADECIKIEVKV